MSHPFWHSAFTYHFPTGSSWFNIHTTYFLDIAGVKQSYRLFHNGQLYRPHRLFRNPVSAALLKHLGGGVPFASFREWTKEQVQNRLDHIDDIKRVEILQQFCRMKDANGNPVRIEEVVIELILRHTPLNFTVRGTLSPRAPQSGSAPSPKSGTRISRARTPMNSDPIDGLRTRKEPRYLTPLL